MLPAHLQGIVSVALELRSQLRVLTLQLLQLELPFLRIGGAKKFRLDFAFRITSNLSARAVFKRSFSICNVTSSLETVESSDAFSLPSTDSSRSLTGLSTRGVSKLSTNCEAIEQLIAPKRLSNG